MGLIDIRIGSRSELPATPQRAEDTAYFCTDGGLYVGPHLIAERNRYQLPIAIYKVDSYNSTYGKLVIDDIQFQSDWSLASMGDGAILMIINPDGVPCGNVEKLENKNGLDTLSFVIPVYFENAMTCVVYSEKVYPVSVY